MNLIKAITFAAISTSLFFTACNKDDDKNSTGADQLAQARNSMVGKWAAKTEAYTGYNSQGVKTDEKLYNYEKDELFLEMTSTNTYKITYDDGSAENGKYELKEQTTKHGVTGYYLSIFLNNSTTETDYAIVNVSGNTLVLNQFDTDTDDNSKEYLSEKYIITFTK